MYRLLSPEVQQGTLWPKPAELIGNISWPINSFGLISGSACISEDRMEDGCYLYRIKALTDISIRTSLYSILYIGAGQKIAIKECERKYIDEKFLWVVDAFQDISLVALSYLDDVEEHNNNGDLDTKDLQRLLSSLETDINMLDEFSDDNMNNVSPEIFAGLTIDISSKENYYISDTSSTTLGEFDCSDSI